MALVTSPGREGGIADYLVVELVGEGSFGKVYKARRRYTGQIVVRAGRCRTRARPTAVAVWRRRRSVRRR